MDAKRDVKAFHAWVFDFLFPRTGMCVAFSVATGENKPFKNSV